MLQASASTPGQLPLREKLQRRPSARRHVRELVGDARLLGGLDALAAADDGDGLRARDELRQRARSLVEGRLLEDAHGPVPEDRARGTEQPPELLERARPDVERHRVRGNLVDRRPSSPGRRRRATSPRRNPTAARSSCRRPCRSPGSRAPAEPCPPRGGTSRRAGRSPSRSGSPSRRRRAAGPPAATARAACRSCPRSWRRRESPRTAARARAAATARGPLSRAAGRRPSRRRASARRRPRRAPVRGSEGVVDVHVGESRERLRERRVVRLLSGMEAEVLEQEHFSVREGAGRALAPPDRRSRRRTAPAVPGARRTARRPARAKARASACPWLCRGARRR